MREIDLKIGRKQYKISTDDSYLDNANGHFEPDMVKLFSLLVHRGDTVIDVGANIGCTALLFNQLAREVHAFEPSKPSYDLLETNLKKAKAKKVTTYNMGLGDEPSSAELTYAATNRSGGFVSDRTKVNAGHTTESIAIDTLDRVVAAQVIDKIDFMKVDIEGFEMRMLQGGRRTIERLRPTCVVELNHWCLNAFQRTSVPEFLDFLKEIFPVLYAVQGDTYRDLYDQDQMYDVLYHHIVSFQFANLVCGFDTDGPIKKFLETYRYA